jgi:hypothetical protein
VPKPYWPHQFHRHESDNTARSWEIELLGDGDRLKDHTDHFDSEGVYRQTRVGGMTEFAIVDFRTTMPTMGHRESFLSSVLFPYSSP